MENHPVDPTRKDASSKRGPGASRSEIKNSATFEHTFRQTFRMFAVFGFSKHLFAKIQLLFAVVQNALMLMKSFRNFSKIKFTETFLRSKYPRFPEISQRNLLNKNNFEKLEKVRKI